MPNTPVTMVPNKFTGEAFRDSGFATVEEIEQASPPSPGKIKAPSRLDRFRQHFSIYEVDDSSEDVRLEELEILPTDDPREVQRKMKERRRIEQEEEAERLEEASRIKDQEQAAKEASMIRKEEKRKQKIADLLTKLTSKKDEEKEKDEGEGEDGGPKRTFKERFLKFIHYQDYPDPPPKKRPAFRKDMRYFGRRGDMADVDATIEMALEPGTTFHYNLYPQHLDKVMPDPDEKHILHIRDSKGIEYLTIETFKGRRYISAGLLNVIVAEIARPSFMCEEPWMTDYLVFSTSTAVGSEELLRAFFNHFFSMKTSLEGQKALIGDFRILAVVRRWLRSQPEDFVESKATTRLFRALILEADRDWEFYEYNEVLKAEFMGKKLLHSAWETYVKENETKFIDQEVVAKTYYDMKNSPPDLPPLEISAMDIAKYLAAIHFSMFRDATGIRTLQAWWKETLDEEVEYVRDNQWRSPQKKPWWRLAHRIERCLNRTQVLIHWTQFEALQPQTLEKRATAIEKLIDIARYLFGFKDFHGSSCIVQGLSTKIVEMIDDTWASVSTVHLEFLAGLKQKLSLENRKYDTTLRKAMKKWNELDGPVIPYFDAFLEELTTIYTKRDHYHREKDTCQENAALHLDYPLDHLGSLDYCDLPKGKRHAENPISMSFQNGLVDCYKYQKLIEALSPYRRASQKTYNFSKFLSNNTWGLLMNVPGMETFRNDDDGEESWKDWEDISEAVERRFLIGWGLRFKTDIDVNWISEPEQCRENTLSILLHFAKTNK
ncbi:ras guanine nucleotide exchange factor domain-containing protein [Geopyxis carbonaria]|nr:ras guanine nucleotide exchange factor domain-containing protein [Geopyxis carbonaria]